MGKREDIFEYIIGKKEELAEEWIERSTGDGADSVFLAGDKGKLHLQHDKLIETVSRIFIESNDEFKLHIDEWSESVAADWVKSGVTMHDTISQFRVIRTDYWNSVKNYILSEKQDFTIEDAFYWSNLVNDAFDFITENFARHFEEAHKNILSSQQQMITELSSPVIPVKRGIGILPLVGDIDTYRARIILETGLEQAAKQKLDMLFIDLSAVPIVDTMVAHQLFQLIDALRLIGVEAILSGIRPEIAQTAVQLGIEFRGIKTQSTLMNALELYS
ncbi:MULTISPECIES: STAS domain-containing protein [Bhargavaea]|uniref:STAS domain-containing protein n=1 Tax=Bhargavaea changchunensis TaxID=2134037 RepID=A0ABW2NHJ3_9BACL|nr:STAS domain-containing protein [Bhargavaea sp. CC-171006]